MIRLFLSLGSIAVAVGLLVSGTVAFFSDTESSVGNVFAAGAFDLKIDNESYYNGNRCTNVSTNPEEEVWQWVGQAEYPVPGTPCSTSFLPSDLGDGLLFFNFTDVKPDDEGEDTISIHVENDAWACLDLTLTENDDESSTEPELATEDALEDPENPLDGELAEGIEFFWWADDGDNVYEEGESGITDGVVSLATLDQTFPVALADSATNVWGEEVGTPVPGGETVYIAKAWCLGDLSLTPVADGQGVNPSVASGVACDGTNLGNEFQTDSASLDISFSAVQARNNGQYLCREPEQPTTGSLTIVKQVNGGEASAGAFSFAVNGTGGPYTGKVSGDTITNLTPGVYTVSEEPGGPANYTPDFSGCEGGSVTISAGEDATCTVVNNFEAPTASLTVNKIVVGGPSDEGDFPLFIDGNSVTDEQVNVVPAGTELTVSETNNSGLYVSVIGGDCDSNGKITLAEDEVAVCTITNTYTPATLTVDKVLTITTGGVAASDFILHISGPGIDMNVSDNVPVPNLPAGEYTVTEVATGPATSLTFNTVYSGACTNNGGLSGTVTLTPGSVLKCFVNNTEVEPE